jgi:hypothetical protein
MLKLLQSITALLLLWVISSVLPDEVIVAEPADTVPSTGLAKTAVVDSITTRTVVDKKPAARKSVLPIKYPIVL